MTAARLRLLGRLTLLTAAALAAVLLAKGGRDYKLISGEVLVLLAAGVGATVILSAQRIPWVPAVAWAIVPLAALAAAAMRHAVSPTAGGDLSRHWIFLLAFVVSAVVLRRSDLKRLVTLWAVTLIFVGGYAVAQKAGWDPVEDYRKFHSQSRPFSTFGNADFLGVHLAFLLPLLAEAVRLNVRPAARLLRYGLLLMAGLILLWTGSRGAWLGALAGFGVWAALVGPTRDWRNVIRSAHTGWVITAAGCLIFVAFLPELARLATRRTDRIPLWQGTMAMVRAKPLTGWGLGSFPSEFPPFAPSAFAARMKADNTFAEHPHCEYLHVAVEQGLLALGIFIWFLVAIVRQGLHRARHGDPWAAGAVGALVAVLVHILVDRNFRLASTAIPFWLVAGVLFARREERPRQSLPSQSLASWTWIAVLLAVSLAAVSLRPLRASYRVEREVDFLTQASEVPAAELEARRGEHASDPGFAMALGNAYAKEKRFPSAVRAFEEVVRLDPGNSGAAVNLGNCWFMMSKFDEAAAVYRNLLARDPGHEDARFNLAFTYYHQRRIKDALRELDELLRRHPGNPKALQLKQQLSP